MISKVMQEIIKLSQCAKSTADLSQIWAPNELLINGLGQNHVIQPREDTHPLTPPRMSAEDKFIRGE